MSRGEMLREASKMNRTCSVLDQEEGNKSKDATEAVLNDEKEAVIAAKTNSAAEFESKIGNEYSIDFITWLQCEQSLSL